MTTAPATDPVSSVTWLFVPGDRPERFAKAAAAGCDEVIIDLEDAVASDRKTAARTSTVDWLSGDGRAWVRVNGADTPWFVSDLAHLLDVRPPGLRGLVVPKATLDVLTRLQALCRDVQGLDVVALVETAEGVRDADLVAARDGVVRLAFGAIDFALDIDAEETFEAMAHARGALVVASRAAGLPGPIDSPTVEVRDPAVAGADARRSRALGFGGKLCIHPAQVGPVAEAHRPDAATLAWAEELSTALAREGVDLATADPSMALAVDGRMVDRPVLLRARRVLAAATRPYPTDS